MLDLGNAAFRLKGFSQEILTLGRFGWYRRLLLSFQIHRLLFLDYRRSVLPGASLDRTYGDTPVLTAYRIGQMLALNSETVWVEPGSGIGLSALTMHLAFGCRILAMEIEPHRHRAAQLLSKSLRLDGAPLEWLNQDFLEVTWPSKACVYLTPTTWSEELWSRVIGKLELECQDGLVLTISRQLPIQAWELLRTEELAFSWGTSRLFVHRRVR